MKEFMLLIRNEGDSESKLSPTVRQEFLKNCENYIYNLKTNKKLIAAQPLLEKG